MLPNNDTLEYIVTKSKGKYDSFSLTGEKLTTQTKKFPSISSELLRDKYYRLNKKYDHVIEMFDLYIVNNGGKTHCKELPVRDSIIIIPYIDPYTKIIDSMDSPALQEICFLQGGETGIFVSHNNNLGTVLPVSDYDEIFLRFNTRVVDILSDPWRYDFSEDSLALFFPKIKYQKKYIISSKDTKYSVHDYNGYQNQVIQDADLVFKADDWFFMKNDSLYKVEESHFPEVKYAQMPKKILYPIIASSDTILWNSPDHYLYPKYFGNEPLLYQWRDRISKSIQLYSKTGNLELHKDSVIGCYFDGFRPIETFVTGDSKVFGIADSHNNILLESLTALSAWGLDYNKNLVNVPVGSMDYFKIKQTVQYLSAQQEGEHLLIDLYGDIVKKSKDPIQLHFKYNDIYNCEYVYEFE